MPFKASPISPITPFSIVCSFIEFPGELELSSMSELTIRSSMMLSDDQRVIQQISLKGFVTRTFETKLSGELEPREKIPGY